MAGYSVSIPGAGDLARDLGDAADALDVDELTLAVAQPIAARAAAAAPRLTGAMARSIRADHNGITVEAGTYPLYVHNGTRYLAARPFLTQAIRPSEIDTIAEQHVEDALDQIRTSYV